MRANRGKPGQAGPSTLSLGAPSRSQASGMDDDVLRSSVFYTKRRDKAPIRTDPARLPGIGDAEQQVVPVYFGIGLQVTFGKADSNGKRV